LAKRPLLQRLQNKRYHDPLIFQIGESQQRLAVDPLVLNHFAEHQQHDDHSPEAGGQLFARFSDRAITITSVTGPRQADRRTRYLYLPNRREEQREIDEMHQKGLHFVGDWHTHPEPVPTPSRSDIHTISEAVAKSRHHLHGFLMVVVGSADFPLGLHVSLNTPTSHMRLMPTL